LEDYYFIGHIHEYGGKGDKIHFPTKRRREIRREATYLANMGQALAWTSLGPPNNRPEKDGG
jgi:hypothetical protein